MKKARIVLSKDAEEVYKYLLRESKNSKNENTILKAFEKKKDLIKIKPHYGDPISKNKIPKKYIDDYRIKNLFRVELPDYWRFLYTLTNDDAQVEIIAFILNISDHIEYNKLFGYKKK